jgi:hypothetical protein
MEEGAHAGAPQRVTQAIGRFRLRDAGLELAGDLGGAAIGEPLHLAMTLELAGRETVRAHDRDPNMRDRSMPAAPR